MKDSHDRLKDARMDAGFSSIAEAARVKSLHKQNLADHEAGRRGIGPEQAVAYSRAFDTTPEWILYGRKSKAREVPVVGYIGAGAEFYAIDDHAKGGGLDRIDAPPDCPENAVAVVVRGDSMLPIYSDGDIVIYSERCADIESFVGRRAIYGLADGRVLLKTLRRGSQPGLYALTSFNSASIEDVVIEWAAKVLWIQPR